MQWLHQQLVAAAVVVVIVTVVGMKVLLSWLQKTQQFSSSL